MSKKARFLGQLSSAVIAVTSLHSIPAWAQDAGTSSEGNDIVVTANKRSSRLQDIPFSISAQTAEDIQKSGAISLEALSRNVAGLTIQNLGPGQSQVAVRGVSAGQIARDQPGVKEQVGIYLDESAISLSLFTPDLDFFDLNRVETLRGPQGTLFGSGSIGGTIRYITSQPKLGVTEGSVEADLNLVDGGNAGGSIKGAINIPLSSTIAARAVGYVTRYNGFIDALTPTGRKKNVNDGYRAGGRLALTFAPTETISFTPRIVYQELHVNGFNRQDAFNFLANPNMTPPTTIKKREQYLLLREAFIDKTLIADGIGKISLGAVDLTSVTSYTHRNILVSRDASTLTGSVSVDLGFPASAVRIPSNLQDRTKLNAFTQELRLSSTGNGPFQWVAGGFYAHIKRTYSQILPTPGYDAITDAVLGAGTSASVANGFGTDSPFTAILPFTLKQLAGFGEGSYKLGRFKLTAGGRYYDYKEDRIFHSGGLFSSLDNRPDKTKSNGFTPRAILSYEPSSKITINAVAAKGFRLGGVNDPLALPLCSPADKAIFGRYQEGYKDETMWTYELNMKTRGHGFSFNAAVFHNAIKNLQTTIDTGTCATRIVFNVPKAHSQGVEFELSASPTETLDLGISGSLVSSKFDATVRDGTGSVIGGIQDGNRLASVPKFQMSADATYHVPVSETATASFRASIQHIGSRYTQPGDQVNNPRAFVSGLAYGGATGTVPTTLDLKLPAYQLVNLSAGIDFGEKTNITFYVTNLFDVNPLLSFDRERGGRARLGFEVGQPRTFGVTARRSF